MEQSIIALQEALSHQSEDILRMSDELYTQQKEIAELHRKLIALEAKLTTVIENEISYNADQEPPPPHY